MQAFIFIFPSSLFDTYQKIFTKEEGKITVNTCIYESVNERLPVRSNEYFEVSLRESFCEFPNFLCPGNTFCSDRTVVLANFQYVTACVHAKLMHTRTICRTSYTTKWRCARNKKK